MHSHLNAASHQLAYAPRVAGFLVKVFAWFLESRIFGTLILYILKRDNLIHKGLDISPEAMAYLEGTLATRYKQWKNNFHTLFKQWNDPEIARLHVRIELKDRPEDWEWLCKHFTDPKFVEGSMFPEIDMFEEVYVRPDNETTKQLHATMVEKRDAVLHEATSQLPSETPIEDVTLPEDVGFQIMTDVLDQNFGRRRGKVVRGMGKARVRETGASSSRSKTIKVNAFKEEVTQLRAEGEQMKVQLRAQDERMKAQDEEVRTCVERVQELVQAIQMAGLQISLPAPHLAPPSTSDPSRPADTQ
ncbi:unnamed protein product [Malus baccata var. baccata]